MSQSPSFPPIESREMICGHYSAWCSQCGWMRVYDPEKVRMRTPDRDLEEAIRAEYAKHKCEDFLSLGEVRHDGSSRG